MRHGILRKEPTPYLTDRHGQNLNDLITKFISEQDVKTTSKRSYESALQQFLKWIEVNRLSLSGLTRTNILAYKEYLLDVGMSTLSIAAYLSSVKRFYEWSESHKLYPNIAKGIKAPRRRQQFKKQSLTTEQSKELIEHFKNSSSRDYAIACVLIGCGLRTIEVIRVNVEDLTFRNGKPILMVHGKGQDSKSDFVKLPQNAYEAIRLYLEERAIVNINSPLFVSKSNNSNDSRLTTRSISRIAKNGLKAIGLNHRSYTAHSLRHTTAVALLKAGMPITDAQSVLRHASVTTTQIYLSSISDELRIMDNTEIILNNILN